MSMNKIIPQTALRKVIPLNSELAVGILDKCKTIELTSLEEFCEQFNLNFKAVLGLIQCTQSPFDGRAYRNTHGHRPTCRRLAAILGCDLGTLFDPEYYQHLRATAPALEVPLSALSREERRSPAMRFIYD